MTNEQLKNFISESTKEAHFQENQQFLIATVPTNDLHKVVKTLKDSASTAFDFLFALTGVDYQPSLGVVYHLRSTKYGHQVVIKASTDNRDKPEIPSITDLYKGAELQEREVYDFLGIKFTNHPDMRRLFLEDDWNGYPLRKDYKDEVNIIDLIK